MVRPVEAFVILNKQRKHPINKRELLRFVARLVDDIGIGNDAFSIVFITDPAMRMYNRRYRGYDKPTDVLSFRGEGGYLGDILIS
jgi:ssRNA-specific RNase YbeY (16S rRNA maturation enzyme)